MTRTCRALAFVPDPDGHGEDRSCGRRGLDADRQVGQTCAIEDGAFFGAFKLINGKGAFSVCVPAAISVRGITWTAEPASSSRSFCTRLLSTNSSSFAFPVPWTIGRDSDGARWFIVERLVRGDAQDRGIPRVKECRALKQRKRVCSAGPDLPEVWREAAEQLPDAGLVDPGRDPQQSSWRPAVRVTWFRWPAAFLRRAPQQKLCSSRQRASMHWTRSMAIRPDMPGSDRFRTIAS